MINIANLRRLFTFAFAALALLGAQTASAFPTGGGSCFFCKPYNGGGSIIEFDLTSIDANDLAPITFNFLADKGQPHDANPKIGRLCMEGSIDATISKDGQTGEAVYKMVGTNKENKGVCYSGVTQHCKTPDNPTNVGDSCFVEECTYTIAPLQTLIDDGKKTSEIVDGRLIVDPTYPLTGPYGEICLDAEGKPKLDDGTICNFQIGFNDLVADQVAPPLFAATTDLNNEPVAANVVLHSKETCIQCSPSDVGLIKGTQALKAKSERFRACEALTAKMDWCNNLQPRPLNTLGIDCFGDEDPTNLPRGGMNTTIGDFQIQAATGEFCVDDLQDLKHLPSCDEAEIAIATCADSATGYMTWPESFEPFPCTEVLGERFAYSPAEGGGSNSVDLALIGATNTAPGYAGDNTLAAVLRGYTAIASTPDNQVNIWDFCGIETRNVAYMHSRNNNDVLIGSALADNILGGSGADVLNGWYGNDILQGGANADTLYGWLGEGITAGCPVLSNIRDGGDLLLGYECDGPNATCSSFVNNGSDDDIMVGGPGKDCSDGGRGNDTHILNDGDGDSDCVVLFGNYDTDTIQNFTTKPNQFDPTNPGEVDVIVDLTGQAAVKMIKGSKKDGLPDICTVTSGGNNVAILEGVDARDCTSENIWIVDLINHSGDEKFLPAAFAGHPYKFQ